MKIFKYTQTELDYLKKKDKKLGAAIDRIGIIKREVTPDLFTALIKSIVGQQISSKAADTVWCRILELLKEITPNAISLVSSEDIQKCGLSMRKVNYIKGISEAVTCGALDLNKLYELSDDEVIKQLSSLNGVGKWTAEMLLIFSMERPNVVSFGDLAIQRGMMRLYGLNELSKDKFEAYRKRYSPYGSVASLYFWAISAES